MSHMNDLLLRRIDGFVGIAFGFGLDDPDSISSLCVTLYFPPSQT